MKKDKRITFFGRLFGGRSCCCGPSIVSMRQIEVNGIKVGITGLKETFARYYDARTKPEDLPVDELVR